MRVLHVINSIEIGGAENFLLRLMQAQQKRGYSLFLLIISPDNNDLKYYEFWKRKCDFQEVHTFKEPVSLKFKILFKMDSLTGKKRAKKWVNNLEHKFYQNILKKHDIQIVNSHLLSSDNFVFRKLALKSKVNWVVTSQGCYNDYDRVDEVSLMIPKINGMTYVAEKNLKIFNETNVSLTSNRKLIYNGLNKDGEENYKQRSDLGLRNDDFVIGQITRSIPEKGMEIAIRAVLELINKGYNHVKLLLIGPENEYYLSLKSKYSHPNILFIGSTKEPLSYVKLFDLGVLPSYFPSESCPSTIVEYLAENKPAIATNIGEVSNMLKSKEGIAGCIVKEKDNQGLPSASHFAEAIEKYINSPSLHKTHEQLCAQAFEKFNMEKIVMDYEEVYQKALLG